MPLKMALPKAAESVGLLDESLVDLTGVTTAADLADHLVVRSVAWMDIMTVVPMGWS